MYLSTLGCRWPVPFMSKIGYHLFDISRIFNVTIWVDWQTCWNLDYSLPNPFHEQMNKCWLFHCLTANKTYKNYGKVFTGSQKQPVSCKRRRKFQNLKTILEIRSSGCTCRQRDHTTNIPEKNIALKGALIFVWTQRAISVTLLLVYY